MKLVSALLLAIVFPTVAAAQSSGIYIQAGPLGDFFFAPGAEGSAVNVGLYPPSSTTYTWNDFNSDRRWQPGEESPILSLGFPALTSSETSRRRVAPGAAAAVGVFITPSVSLRLEGSFQGEQVTTTEAGGLGAVLTAVDRQATATTDLFVSAGWHQGQSRTTITYLAGMVFRRQREEATLSYTYAPRSLPTTIGQSMVFGQLASSTFDDRFAATSYSAGIMAGIDVAIGFSEHLALVPQLRMVAAGHTLSVRPGVALRWHP